MAAILDFCTERWLLVLALQVNPMPPTKFRISWFFGSGEEAKIVSKKGRHGVICDF